MVLKKTNSIKLILPALIFCSLIFTACEKPQPQQEGWTSWLGPNGNGTITDASFNPAFLGSGDPVQWRVMIGSGYSGLSVSNNRLYTMGMKNDSKKKSDVIYCINTANGKTVWSYEYTPAKNYEFEGPRAMPVIAGDSLYTVSSDGDVIALNVHKGKLLWARNVAREENAKINTWGISGSAVIEKGVIYLNIGGGIALDAATGKTLWKGPDLANGYATPVLFDYKGARTIMLLSARHILMLSAADGKEIARHDWINDYDVNGANPLIIDDQSVLLSSTYRREGCARFDFASGEFVQRWNVMGISTHFSTPILHDGALYGIHGDTNARGRCAFVCLDPETGEVLWKQDTYMYGSIIKVNDTFIYLNENGQLCTVEPSKSAYTASAAKDILTGRGNSWVAPSYWKGRLYLRSNSGELVCLKADM